MSWLASTALLGVLCTSTRPTVFVTEPLAAGAGGHLVCRVVNEAPARRRVRIEALDEADHATVDSGTFNLEPGASFVSGGGVDARRCRFTVVGEASGVRAHGLEVSPVLGAVSLPPHPASRREIGRWSGAAEARPAPRVVGAAAEARPAPR